MPTVTPFIIAMVLASAGFQILGVSLLPLTKGLAQPLPTLGVAICFAFGIGIMARLSHIGANLSALVPLMATIIPLGAVVVGVLVYGESASLPRVGMLVAACCLIGFSSMV